MSIYEFVKRSAFSKFRLIFLIVTSENQSTKLFKKCMQFKEDPSHRYRKEKDPKDGKFYFHCCSTKVVGNRIVQCSFFKRYDHFKQYLLANQPHRCKYDTNSNNKGTLYQFVNAPNSNDSMINNERLLTEIARCIGSMNLSTTFGSSEQLRNLLVYAAAYGAINVSNVDPLRSAESLIPRFDRRDIRSRIISLAHDLKQKAYSHFSELPYISLAADEGSTRGNKNMDFVAECPDSDLRSFPILTLKMESLYATSYAKVFNIALRILNAHKIKVGTIIVDGHRGQLKALNPKWRYSIFRTNTYFYIRSLIVVPCICHRIHNAFKNASRSNQSIHNAIENLHNSAYNLRNNIISVGATCPPHIETRWVNDADIAFFHLKHNISFDYSEELIPILVIFKTLILEFENSKAHLSIVYPRVEEALEALDELEQLKQNFFAPYFRESLNKYTLGSEDAGIWLLSYLFTPSGHDDYRRRIIQNHPKPYGTDFLSKFKIERFVKKDEIDETIEELIEDNVRYVIENNEEPEQEMPDVEMNGLITNPNTSINDISDSDEADEDEEIVPNQSFNSCINMAMTFLEECIMKQDIDEESAHRMVSSFQQFLISPATLPVIKENNRFNWLIMRYSDPEWKTIADVALRLEASVPSEAACEREISQQRLIQTARRMRSKRDLLDARLILVQAGK